MPHLYLIGMPGAGKSTLGKLLAAELDRPFVDLDAAIERAAGASIAEIFERNGEAFFRDLEAETLKTVANSGEKLVIATGGGTPCFPDNLALMNHTGLMIYLKTDPEILAERLLATGMESRPLLKKLADRTLLLSHLQETMAFRETFYQQAGIIFESRSSRYSPGQAVNALLALLERYNRTA